MADPSIARMPAAAPTPGILSRIKRILFNPRSEWPVIAAEPSSPAALYRGYIAPLAAIGPIATVIGMSVIGIPMPFAGTFRVPVTEALSDALVSWLLVLGAAFLIAVLVNQIAGLFGGRRNMVQALKMVAYSYTPLWLAGIFSIMPWLGVLMFPAGLWGIWLFRLGLGSVMEVPQRRRTLCTLACIAATIAVGMAMLAATLVLTGSGADLMPRTAAVDACELVTEADAQAVLGQPVMRESGEGGFCTYGSRNQNLDVASLTISVESTRDAKSAFDMSVQMNEAVGGMMESMMPGSGNGRRALDGIGDEAVLLASSPGGFIATTTLIARQGDAVITLSTVTAGTPVSSDALQDVARRAMAGL